eukprot:m.114546 g.114546  ORF g.114546 m.114546 type:complete len:265 (+) comp16303_c0_seq6:1142-1936(+)
MLHSVVCWPCLLQSPSLGPPRLFVRVTMHNLQGLAQGSKRSRGGRKRKRTGNRAVLGLFAADAPATACVFCNQHEKVDVVCTVCAAESHVACAQASECPPTLKDAEDSGSSWTCSSCRKAAPSFCSECRKGLRIQEALGPCGLCLRTLHHACLRPWLGAPAETRLPPLAAPELASATLNSYSASEEGEQDHKAEDDGVEIAEATASVPATAHSTSAAAAPKRPRLAIEQRRSTSTQVTQKHERDEQVLLCSRCFDAQCDGAAST